MDPDERLRPGSPPEHITTRAGDWDVTQSCRSARRRRQSTTVGIGALVLPDLEKTETGSDEHDLGGGCLRRERREALAILSRLFGREFAARQADQCTKRFQVP
jgi:hypothetical protein